VKFPPGLIVTGVAMLFFYLRLAQLRGRKRKLARQQALELRKSAKNKKKSQTTAAAQPIDFEHPRYEVKSWAMVAVALILMLASVVMYTARWFPSQYQQYWWIAATAGVLLFSFCFK
jgi:uncharacterized membrane protein YcjF (UPF0283 family)